MENKVKGIEEAEVEGGRGRGEGGEGKRRGRRRKKQTSNRRDTLGKYMRKRRNKTKRK